MPAVRKSAVPLAPRLAPPALRLVAHRPAKPGAGRICAQMLPKRQLPRQPSMRKSEGVPPCHAHLRTKGHAHPREEHAHPCVVSAAPTI